MIDVNWPWTAKASTGPPCKGEDSHQLRNGDELYKMVGLGSVSVSNYMVGLDVDRRWTAKTFTGHPAKGVYSQRPIDGK